MDEKRANAIVIDGSDIENTEESDVEVVDDMEVEEVDENGVPGPQGPFTDPLKQATNEKYPLATDHVRLAERLMKPIPDYPVKSEAFHTWEITDWNAIRREEKVRGPQFECGGFRWNVLLFPRGNNDTISVYMEPHPIVEADETPDPAWYVCAQFALDLWNPQHPESQYPSALSHRFNKNETDWGFSSFITNRDLASQSKVNQPHPILENNKFNITGYVRVIDDASTGVLWHNFMDYDSKANTGYVGLNNQGATCYLNSLLQSYYTTRVFRDLVCQIPTDNLTENSSNKAVPLALQRIFYHLQLSNDPVGTLELTKSFGWDSSDAFTQHDVQELNRVLMDKLELAMKGTKIEKKLNDVFVGKMKSFIKCVNVPYESAREEDFWDIQLNVKGFKNLQESFENYIEVEMLDGENKYQAGDEYGYQDAKKGVVFESFPPVLHLQLKRFEYDFMEDDLVKIDDLYEFPDKIDLSPYLDDDLPTEVKNENWNYKLHGVLVHQGSISNGHYYAMIKPDADRETWLRFDDDKVWKATPTQVFQENFGAPALSPAQLRQLSRLEQNEHFLRRATSAYMLVYYREKELSQVLPSELAPIPNHVAEQIDKEREELANWERSKREALFYMNVKILTADNFAYYNGFDIYPDPSKPKLYDANVFDKRAYPYSMIVKKDAKFSSLYKLVAKKLGYIEGDFEEEKIEDLSIEEIKEDNGEPAESPASEDDDLTHYPFRLVPVKHRNNKTSRPDIAVPNDLATTSVTQVYTKLFKRKYDEMVFFVEEPRKELSHIASSGNVLAPESFDFDATAEKITSNKVEVAPTDFKENDIYLFIKYFDPVTDEVRGLTYFAVPKDTVVSSLVAPINKLLQFDPQTPIQFFEEVSPARIESVDAELTLEKNELSTGDVLTVQLADVESAAFGKKFGNANDYYKFLFTRLHIYVKPCKTKDDEEDSDFVQEEVHDRADNEKEVNPEATEEKEIELAKEMSRSFDLWVSSSYSYQELANEIAKKLNDDVNPEYLRLFVVNSHGARFPLSSHLSLSQIFTKQVAVSTITQFEYEILNITLKEYENMKAIKISWLNSILQSHLLDLLVPKTSTVAEVIKKLIHKLDIPEQQWSNLLVWAGQENKYADLIKFDKPIDEINDQYEIYCGYFPAEVEILSSHDIFKRFDENYISASDIKDDVLRKEFEKAQEYSKLLNIIPVFHFYKTTSYVHSRPFVFAVYPDEPAEETKERLRKKLGLGLQAFEKIKIALADMNDKGRYLDFDKAGVNLFEEVTKFDAHVSLALDHPDRNPRRSNPFDKGISIR